MIRELLDLIPKVSWHEFLMTIQQGIYLCFYSRHYGNQDFEHIHMVQRIAKIYPRVPCLNIDWGEASYFGNYNKDQMRDVFVVVNQQEILRYTSPDLEKIANAFKTIVSLCEGVTTLGASDYVRSPKFLAVREKSTGIPAPKDDEKPSTSSAAMSLTSENAEIPIIKRRFVSNRACKTLPSRSILKKYSFLRQRGVLGRPVSCFETPGKSIPTGLTQSNKSKKSQIVSKPSLTPSPPHINGQNSQSFQETRLLFEDLKKRHRSNSGSSSGSDTTKSRNSGSLKKPRKT